MPRVAVVLAVGSLLLAGAAAAQVRGSLDVGAGTYRPDRAIPGGVASIAPTLSFDDRWFRLGASGVYSDAPAGRWNFQGTGLAQVRSPELGPLQLELTGQMEMTRHVAAQGVTATMAELRGYLRPFPGTTIWAGGVRGHARSLGSRRPLNRHLIGASTRLGRVEIGLTLASSTFDLVGGGIARGGSTPQDTTLTGTPVAPEESEGSPSSRHRSLTDALLSTRWRLANVDLDLALGRRFGRGTPELTIWGVSAARSITSNLAIVGAAGRAGSDPVTSMPGARYFVMGLRLKLGAQPMAAFAPASTARDNTPFAIGPALPAGREVVVRAPGATRVELAGDFTDWRPVALQPEGDGDWRAVLQIRSGLHRFAVRIDEGEWQAPPGTRAVRSEFGGEVAEVVVE